MPTCCDRLDIWNILRMYYLAVKTLFISLSGKATRSNQFGSNLSLDMVHPHPDLQNGFSQSHMVKNISYKALSDP